jgi:hypothetical protein
MQNHLSKIARARAVTLCIASIALSACGGESSSDSSKAAAFSTSSSGAIGSSSGGSSSSSSSSSGGGSSSSSSSSSGTSTSSSSGSSSGSAALNHYATMADASPGIAGNSNGDIAFPKDNAWNTDISDVSTYPADPNSAALIAHIGAGTGLHMDFGTTAELYGIPYTVVDSTQPLVAVSINSSTGYASESDVFAMPIPANAPIEGGSHYADGGGDGHVIVVSRSAVTGRVQQLFELWHAQPQTDGSWTADSSAAFDIASDNVRPTTAGQCDITSADAAGLPIFPGLARFDEIESGAIHHALRFTVSSSRAAFVPPANHWASSSTATDFPPMGMRVRLKASYAIPSTFSKESQVLLQALKTYGMIVADNGSNWYVSGATDDRWANLPLFSELSSVKGSNFEVIQMSGLVTSCQ